MSLNELQLFAIKCVKNKENIFITSRGAGCGKTYLLNNIIDKFGNFWGYNKTLAVTATTGVASLLLKNGRTINSWAGIGLGNNTVENLYNDILKHNKKNKWTSVDILIIDEISLMPPELLEKLEKLGRMLRDNDKPFGGIQLIFSGDWLQLPTVNGKNYAFESDIWDKCIDRTIYLTEIMRQKDDKFKKILNDIRVGNINQEVKDTLLSRINVKLHNNIGITPTKLFCVNEDVNKINNNQLNTLIKNNAKYKIYNIEWNSKYENNYSKYIKMCYLDEKLILAKGCQVMLIKNLCIDDKLVNGSRGVIDDFDIHGSPIVSFLNGITITLEKVNHDIFIDEKLVGTFTQFPLRLAYASTIHKMQGSTLDYVIVDLERIFELSQGYVGLSRVTDLSGLCIEKINFNNFKVSPKALKFYNDLESHTHSLE